MTLLYLIDIITERNIRILRGMMNNVFVNIQMDNKKDKIEN